ncbi:hypothetical protein H9P43_009348 [Blastocladiella emersonii ATCC 22665]|nr:hypothetical protein H9P43_009348 [Blastocladiella emersonii ATCC 22665]
MDPQGVLGMLLHNPNAYTLPLEFWRCVPDGAFDGMWALADVAKLAVHLAGMDAVRAHAAMSELARVAPSDIEQAEFHNAIREMSEAVNTYETLAALGKVLQEKQSRSKE